MKSFLQLTLVKYGIIVSAIGLVLYLGLTALATKQLDVLREGYEEEHRSAAVSELQTAIEVLQTASEQFSDDFYSWEELTQQIQDPTYYDYWRKNRVTSANFVPLYFRKIFLFDKNQTPLAADSGENIKRTFGLELEQAVIHENFGGPLIERCRAIVEEYGQKNIIGYFCVEMDLYQGLTTVQTFNYLDMDTLTLVNSADALITFDNLLSKLNFSVKSEQTLSRMHELTVDTIISYLAVSAVLIIIFLYMLSIPVARPLRELSAYINALHTSGPKNSLSSISRYFSITELNTVYQSINEYQERLKSSAEELKASEEHFRSIIENSSDVVMKLNKKGVITYISPSVESVLGYKEDEILGDHLIEHVQGEDIESVRTSIDFSGRNHDESLANEFRFRHRNGEWVTLEFGGDIISDDGESCTLNCRDITDRKKAQEAMSIARDKALEASKLKTNFLANTSHELRTPLNAIIGYSEIILEDLEDNNNDNIKSDINKVHIAADNLLHLIDEVLDLSKIESGKMEISVEVFLVKPLLEEIERTILPLVNKNKNSLRVKIEKSIHEMSTDRNKLRQIIFNLLNNAAKFTHKGDLTLDVISRKEGERDWIDFIIADTGIGMSEDQLGKVFEPFTQADASTTRQFGGTGLGLTICRDFAQILGGDIKTLSKEGVGSTFTLSLPCTLRSSEVGYHLI